MKNIKISFLTILVSILSCYSCKKFLDKPNKLQTDIKTADQLDALINNAVLFYSEDNSTAVFSTDDIEISKLLISNYPAFTTLNNLFYYTWDINNITNLGTDYLWTAEYKKIFTANVILSNVDNVSGSDNQKKQIKADAYFIRAISNWTLINYYSLPYDSSNLKALGIPLKKSTSYDEAIPRSSVEDCYAAILSDVLEAKALTQNTDVNPLMRWRVSQSTINAFLSRFYLFLGDYSKCISYADSALKSETVKLIDYNTVPSGISASYSNPIAVLNYATLNDWAANKFLYWDELFYTRFVYNASQNFIPSPSLLSLYDTTNDMRYRLLMIPNGGRRFNTIVPSQFRYTFFNDGRYLIDGPGIAEVLLNKAEAYARINNVEDAVNTVNVLHLKRVKTGTLISASNPKDALNEILKERRRELPFSFRWLDIRRFSVTPDPSDDISISRPFYDITSSGVDLTTPVTYTLPVKSLRYAIPINTIEITNSQGQIFQNNY